MIGTIQSVAARLFAAAVFMLSAIAVNAWGAEERVWVAPDVILTARGALAADTLRRAHEQGLKPEEYWPWGDGLPDGVDGAAWDRAIEDALLRYISDVRDGRPAPRIADPELFVIPTETDAKAVLAAGLAEGDFAAWLSKLPPQSARYLGLRDALARYRDLAQLPWGQVPDARKLEAGMTDPAVSVLRGRLRLLGDLEDENDIGGNRFDVDLRAAVIRFQLRHGLKPDGVVGPKTRAALDVPPAARATRIALNMERLRWLPDDFGPRYVLVNISGFDLTAVSGGVEVLRMPVIVGRDQRRTPVLTDRIVNVVFHPTWTVPPKLARKDILPKIKADPEYLNHMGITVFRSWNGDAPVVDPDGIDWAAIQPNRLSFKFRQEAGPKNALGRIRFSLTNPQDIYLHDTPEKTLFEKPDRSVSSGCVRVSRPLALAAFAFAPSEKWTRDALQDAMNGSATTVVKLPQPLPGYLT
ncbi:MAG: L,D-transpeptidase family protein, partial [Alphaproteobacteria bacterium]|nr:L,D-transpeptidase family protein [Alphaproteobacteria bacterium]